MNLIKKNSWNNAHIYFFFLFLFSIPFQARKVFLTEYSFYSGAFTEYATFFLYISDILLILTLIFWLVFDKKLYFRINTLIGSINSFFCKNNKRGGIFRKFLNINRLSSVWLLLFIFIIWLIISAVVNNSYTEISIFYILKFIELSLLIVYVYFNLRNKNRLVTALFAISFAGFFQGLVAIYQFIYQCPLFKHPFLHKLSGESTVYPQLSGIAKIIVENEKFVRAYGTFPHPNILGGFLIVSTMISIYLLLKHKRYILSMLRLKLKYNNTNSSKSQGEVFSLALSLFWVIFIFTQITALLFTFSRTAWIGFLISLLLIAIFYLYRSVIVSRETITVNKTNKDTLNYNIAKFVTVSLSNYDKFSELATLRPFDKLKINSAQGDRLKLLNNKIFGRKLNNEIVSRETITKKTGMNYYYLFYRFKELVIIILLTLALITVYFPHINSRINEELSANNFSSSNYLPSNYAFNDRNFYNNVSRETISENFIFGSGPGTFIFHINSYLTKNNIYQKLEPWQYQPAHNIYFLIISEIGIIGFIIVALFIVKIMICNFRIIKKPLNKRFYLINNFDSSSIVSRETIEENKMDKNILNYNINKFGVFTIFRSFNKLKINLAQGNILKLFNNKIFGRKLNNEIVSRETISKDLSPTLNYYLLAIFISFLFIGLFDHYFWTLQQGRLIFWLILGLMLVNSRLSKK